MQCVWHMEHGVCYGGACVVVAVVPEQNVLGVVDIAEAHALWLRSSNDASLLAQKILCGCRQNAYGL